MEYLFAFIYITIYQGNPKTRCGITPVNALQKYKRGLKKRVGVININAMHYKRSDKHINLLIYRPHIKPNL